MQRFVSELKSHSVETVSSVTVIKSCVIEGFKQILLKSYFIYLLVLNVFTGMMGILKEVLYCFSTNWFNQFI